ncbi:hypothetical protein QBC40DRAFT_315471 [Triangularia verruculosa]|uniref:Uncharacterized protein n=1 Tax=Triangularia verruculosa TaxID=2587418 RepID=A0AAN7AZ29_9PEZI|nr:hypothetical protein QBC40DRAFT_315471 [Triangularia verruculosa]
MLRRLFKTRANWPTSRSLIKGTLEKAKSLDEESSWHWQAIESGYYMFNNCQLIVDYLETLTKADMIEFFNHYIKPSSPSRAKVAAYLEAQAKSDVTTKQITDLITTLDLGESTAAQTATDLQSRLSAAGHDEEKEVEGLVDYLHGLGVPEAKVKVASEVWRKLHSEHGHGNGVVKDAEPPSSNGTTPTPIKDVRDFKALHATSRAPYPEKDLAEYYDWIHPKQSSLDLVSRNLEPRI